MTGRILLVAFVLAWAAAFGACAHDPLGNIPPHQIGIA